MGKGRSQSQPSSSSSPPSSSSQPSSSPRDVEKGTSHGSKSHHKRKLPPPPPPPEPWKAWLMPVVFVAYVVIFVYTMYVNDCPRSSGPQKCVMTKYLGRFSFQRFKDNPLLGPSVATLQKLGALDWKQVVEEKEYWRLFTCMWLHAGLIHLMVNMISLLFLGIRMEKEFGFLRVGALYMVSGLGASLTSELSPARKQSISVGASGALFGLLGAMLSELITNWTNYTNKCAALSTMVLIIGLNLAVGFIPRVDNSAHIGGFIFGFLAGFVVLIRPQYGYVSSKHVPDGYKMKYKIAKHNGYQYALLAIALVLLIIGFGFGLKELIAGHTF